jgi:predicted DNA-binding ribbon-helix-helix protein
VKSSIVKRSIFVAGHKTSVSLENAFWQELKEIAGGRHMTLSDLAGAIESERRHSNLSSAIRLFVLDYYRNQAPPPIGYPELGEHEGLSMPASAGAARGASYPHLTSVHPTRRSRP